MQFNASDMIAQLQMFLCIKGKSIYVEMIEWFRYTRKCVIWQSL